MDNRSTEDKKMTEYQWDEEFYRQIVIDHNYRFPKFNNIDYPILISFKLPYSIFLSLFKTIFSEILNRLI